MHSTLRPLVFCLIVACGGTGGDSAQLKYYGEDNKEVILSFNTWFEIPLTEFSDVPKVLAGTASGVDRKRITDEIDLQILRIIQERFAKQRELNTESSKNSLIGSDLIIHIPIRQFFTVTF